VVAVVNSHLHFDHCGGNPLFPGVPIYVQPAEYEASRTPMYTVPDWVDFPGANYIHRAGDHEVVPGVRVLATPGHAPGHQSIAAETPRGTVILVGQAVYSPEEYEHIDKNGTLPPDKPGDDSEEYLRSARRLTAMRPSRVHFSHDRAVWDAG
jgi:glyoxylase-like metal-dependent hydrolase (beta-lactamase superfamily II)